MPSFRPVRAGTRLSRKRITRRLAATDPGLAGLRLAAAATVSMGVVLAVEYAYALSAHAADPRPAMILGGVSAMQVSGALMQPRRQQRLRVAMWHVVVVGAGLTAGLVGLELGGRASQLALFIPVTFMAVAVRRFGPQFVTLGLMGWAGYFITVFLSPAPSEVSFLLGAVVLSATTSFAVSLAIWRHRPATALRHTLHAWSAKGDALLRTAAEAVDDSSGSRHRARLDARLASQATDLTDTALLAEGWLSYPTTDSTSGGPSETRRQLLEAHIAIDSIVEAVRTTQTELPGSQDAARAAAFQVLTFLGEGADTAAEQRADELLATHLRAVTSDDHATVPPALIVARAARTLVSARRTWGRSGPQSNDTGTFTPAIMLLAGGTLPGSAGAASHTLPRSHRIFHGLPFSTRQAIQATVATAIALPLGYWISPVHYLWAMVAVFIVFLGTSTRGETAVKAVHRVLGTAAGILAAIPIAALTAGNPLGVVAVVLICCFIGHYLMTVSYSYMMFCITVAVLQLYDLMGQLSAQLLYLRLTETVLGAAVAVVIATMVLPISTRDATAHVHRSLFQAVASLLTDAADRLEAGGPIDSAEMSRAIRDIEDAARRHRVVSAPLSWNPRHRGSHHATNTSYAALATQIRHTGAWVSTSSSTSTPETALALRALARTANELVHEHPTRENRTTTSPWEEARPDHVSSTHPLTRLHDRLHAIDRYV